MLCSRNVCWRLTDQTGIFSRTFYICFCYYVQVTVFYLWKVNELVLVTWGITGKELKVIKPASEHLIHKSAFVPLWLSLYASMPRLIYVEQYVVLFMGGSYQSNVLCWLWLLYYVGVMPSCMHYYFSINSLV